jgi:ATP-dependent RNA helicase CshB
LIFANTRKKVEELYRILLENNKNCIMLHKDVSFRERKNIYNDIQSNKFQYIVASDLLARGIDINGVDMVISYGLPEDDK